MSHLFRSAIALALFAVSSSIALHADPLPPLYYFASVSSTGEGNGSEVAAGSSFEYALPIQVASTAGLFAQVGGGTDPFVNTRFLPSGPVPTTLPYQTSNAQAVLRYYFEVNGPANQTVSMNIGSKGWAELDGPQLTNFGADATLAISPTTDPTNYLLSDIACAGDTSHFPTSPCTKNPGSPAAFNINGTVLVQTNTPYLVSMASETYFYTLLNKPFPEVSAISGVDPTITLDTLDPAYSLSFSPGLTPDSSPVPEPGTLALTLSGIAALAFAYPNRRRSRSGVPVTM